MKRARTVMSQLAALGSVGPTIQLCPTVTGMM